MARARNIKPGFFRNADLVELPVETRLLFAGLWTIADKSGRLDDRPKQIKMEIYPADSFNVDAMLQELHVSGFIERYSVNEIKYIQITNFTKHQNPHRDEKASTIPAPCEHGANTVQNALIPDSLQPDSLIPETGFPSKDLSAPSAQPNKKGTRLSADWVLPKAWGEWALTEKPAWTADDVRRVADGFKDHWLANANQPKSKKADWLATWRNWVRSPLNEVKLAKPANKHTALVDSNRAAADEWLRQSERAVS